MSNFWIACREKLGLSQRGMAHRLGVSNTAISHWEADERIPTLSIKQLADGYNASEPAIERALMDQRKRIEERKAAAAER